MLKIRSHVFQPINLRMGGSDWITFHAWSVKRGEGSWGGKETHCNHRRGPNYIFNQWQLAFSYLLNPFLLATALTNEISSFLYINQLGSISTFFWRYPLKSVRRKALGWISYFMPSSSSVPPNVFLNLILNAWLLYVYWPANKQKQL